MLRNVVVSMFIALGATAGYADGYVVAAFGDSITQGTNSVVLGSNPGRSWATGDRLRSHAVLLSEDLGIPVTTLNLSVNGAESSDLDSEIDNLAGGGPQYVTIMVGANDVCNGWHDGTAANITAAVSRLSALTPAPHIVVVPIPNLLSLYEVGSQRLGCKARWRLFNICPVMLDRDLTDDDRVAAQQRIDAINDAIGVGVSAYPNVSYDRELGNVQLSDEDVGHIDCFHPSVVGQQLISDLTYTGVP